ncbi:natural resistance-associated macrophage protein-domain-containing protein [Phakopsora pachyrhizi]|uniref:Natural resistance-associated macrophage protein-domain-containing protein n=1 Tax=Phakopsora pachyrhizi TaxID=170000 RepID=A0AAV0ANU5_PHAPC|nr:natural resistance-associated macrophage protein-domain-containing protein [Phakopsora pachyrhizi]CAH7669695.1 natural resistance-associated macrophage protein-domain-containing protein [Phakopsora pachyrhizi]
MARLLTSENFRLSKCLSEKLKRPIINHAKFVGPGIVAAVAYADPGNWATDLEAGSKFGYCHLFIVLLASSMAILLQILAAKLGYITGEDLAQQCRTNYHDRSKNKLLWRWCCLYPLYVIAEVAIILTDLAELLGSAIALNILFPKLPLFAGVLLTSLDVFIVLIFFNSYPSAANQRAMLLFEFSIAVMVLAVLGAFIYLIVKVKPDWGQTFYGFIPQKDLFRPGGLYLAVSMIGATVMPHALFLGSKVAIVDRWVPDFRPKVVQPGERFDSSLIESLSKDPNVFASETHPSGDSIEETDSKVDESVGDLEHTKRHIVHSSVDIAISLLFVALPINAAIVIVAGTAFYFKNNGEKPVADLYAAQKLLSETIGSIAGYVFAVTLLIAGQAASITVTLAGQAVSEGFLEWRTSPVVRRLVTRSIGIVPSAVVAAAVGPKGVDSMLIISQVGLSLALPFVIGPLILFTASPKIMSIYVSIEEILRDAKSSKKLQKTALASGDSGNDHYWTNRLEYNAVARKDSPRIRFEETVTTNDDIEVMVGVESDASNLKIKSQDQTSNSVAPLLTYSFANSRATVIVTAIIFVIVVSANIYALVEVSKGES